MLGQVPSNGIKTKLEARWAILDVSEATPHLPPNRNMILSKYNKLLLERAWKSCAMLSALCPERCLVPCACRNLACALSLFAFSVCSGAVNKEIDDKVVEKRQLDRTARHEWQRARSAFTAESAAPSREPAMPGRCAKPVQRVGRRAAACTKDFN